MVYADPNLDSMADTASAAKDNEHNCDALKENLKENVKENLKIGYQLIRVMMVVTITAVLLCVVAWIYQIKEILSIPS